MNAASLNATGERMILEEYTSSIEDYVIYLMHVASYQWVASIIKGKRVLDFGCGSGYGAAEMAKHATSVTAIDVSDEAIEYAKATYSRSNLIYRSFNPGEALPFDDASFDVVISFQVIEHVSDPDMYAKEARRLLTPGGAMIVITPDRAYRLLPGQKPWNRWHIDEFSATGLQTLLSRHFAQVDMKSMSGDEALWKPEVNRCRKLKWVTLPFTLPIYPRAMRIGLLNLLHRVNKRGGKPNSGSVYPVDETNVRIGTSLQPSLNLVAIATA